MVDPKKLAPRINKANAIQGSAEIDGKEDDIWQLAKYFPSPPASEELNTEVKALWDKEYLYLLLEVTESTPGQDDAVTLFIEEKNEKSDFPDENDRTIEFDFNSDWKDTEDSIFNKTDSGYIFETRIPFEHIEGSEGISIGLDIQVKNGENIPAKWNDKNNIAVDTPKYWGVVDFTAAPSGAIAYTIMFRLFLLYK